MTRRYVAVAAAALALLAGACGGGGDDESAGVASIDGEQAGSKTKRGGTRDPEEAALAYAKCMRANGVDVPDPDANGMFPIEPGTPLPDQAAMERGDQACRAEREAMQGSIGEPDRDFQDKALAMSRCLREHGIDVPDPTLSDDGRASLELDPDQMDRPEFKQAQETCRKQVGMPEPGAAPRSAS